MAGNRNTPKSLAPKSAQEKTGGRYGGGNANVSKQTTPGSKGVFVGKNAQKMKYGGTKRK
jgi:hypothetical protein